MRKSLLLLLLILMFIPVPISTAEEFTSIDQQNQTGRAIATVTGSNAGLSEKYGVTDQESIAVSFLNGKRIGIQTGTNYTPMVEEKLPDAHIFYYNSYTDLVTALVGNKIDAFTTDEPVIRFIMNEDPEVSYIYEYMEPFDFAYVFSKNQKGQKLCEEFNEFLTRIKNDGTIQEIDDIWFGTDESKKTLPDYTSFPAKNGKLRMATQSVNPPFAYVENGEVVGYEIDIAVRFCEAYGYGLVIDDMNFDSILPSVQSGKDNFGGATIAITDERKESVIFSDPNYSGGVVFAIRASDVVNLPESEISYYNSNSDLVTALAGKKIDGFPIDIPVGVYKSLSELSGETLGVQTGQSFDQNIMETIPDAEITYLNGKADLVNALLTNKIEGFAADEPVAKTLIRSNDELTYIPEYMNSFEFGYVFAKDEDGAALRDQFSEFINQIKADGTLSEIDARWFSEDKTGKTVPDYGNFPAPNGVLHMATEALYEPFSYISNNEIVGYDIDIAARFCEAYGYGLEIEDMSFSSILPSVVSGKDDFGCAGITITAERAESVNFSEPNYSGGTVIIVRRENNQAEVFQQPSFTDFLKSSFEKTFIRENRWKLIVEGIRNTLLITVLAVLFGTILGFLLFMLCRNGNRIANLLTSKVLWLVQGMPGVVLLMILFYIVFGSVAIDGMIVSVIGFTITFGASVFGLLKMGVGAIDRGQYEASYALGYSDLRTFFRMILPQAIPHVIDAYKGEIVSLLKATAIVGYIAVQDLTKMGDIIRSRTYEAFFPLIAVTVIYYGLELLLGAIIKRIQIKIDPKKRKPEDILKGLKTHD